MVYFSLTNFKFIQKLMNLTLFQLLKVLSLVIFTFLCIFYSDKSSKAWTSYEPSDLIVWWTLSFPGTSETRYCPGDLQCRVVSSNTVGRNKVGAYLFYGSNLSFNYLPLPRNSSVLWGLYHEESPRNVEELMHEEILRIFNYSSTFSRDSDVPFPLQYLTSMFDITSKEYYIDTQKKNEYIKEIAPVMYLQSDCDTSTQRDLYVRELMKFIKIDSYGECLKNKNLSKKFTENYLNNLDEDEFLMFISRYKFVIAIENGVCRDYLTEKFWRAIKVGSVPIYFGATSIKDWLPNPKSALLLEDFPTPQAMSQQIYKLLGNDKLYEQYLEHKTKQLITNKNLIKEIKQREYQFDTSSILKRFECFICQKLQEKRKGNLITQTVDKTHYNCPKPLSALTLSVNHSNEWVLSWNSMKHNIKRIIGAIN